MGNGRTKVVCPPRFTANRSHSIRDSRAASTVSRKLLQCACVWKPTRSAPSRPSDEFALPRTDAERFGIGPGDVPENRHARVGPRFLDHARQQREMVILHQNERVLDAFDLCQHQRRRICGSPPDSFASPRRGKSAGCARCGTAAIALRSRIRSNSLVPLLW